MLILLLTLACLLLLRLPLALYIGSFRDMCRWDTFSHRLFFRSLVQKRGRISHVRAPHYLLDAGREGPITYPLGYHAFLHGCGMTERTFERYGHLLPLLWDALLIAASFAAMRHFGALETRWLLFLPFQQIFTFRFLRAFHHSERAFGTLFCNLFVLSAIGIVQEGAQPAWLCIGIFSVIIVTVSSKFGWQMLLLLTPISSLLIRNPLPILWLLACIAVSIVCTGGYALRVLRGLASHVRFCRLELLRQSNGTSPHSSATLRELCNLIRRGRWQECASRSYEHVILLMILLLPLTIVAADALLRTQTLDIINVWWIAGVIAVLLVSLRPLACIGKPERYIEGVTIPLMLWLSFIPFQTVTPLVFWSCVLLSALATVLSTASVFWRYNGSLRQQGIHEAEAIAFLKNMAATSPQPPILLSIPLWFCTKIHLATEVFRFLSFIGGTPESRHAEVLRLLWNWEGAVYPDLHDIVDRYRVQYLVIDRRFEQSLNQRYGRPFYPSKPGTVIFENPSIEIRSMTSGTDATGACMEQPCDSW